MLQIQIYQKKKLANHHEMHVTVCFGVVREHLQHRHIKDNACVKPYNHLTCSLDRHTYQCEAAVQLPVRTAVAGLLLTAALLGHCFSETAANSMKKGEP